MAQEIILPNPQVDKASVSVKQEITEILSLTPSESRQDRLSQSAAMAQRYARLKTKLTGASNLAVGELTMRHHRYATTEFDRRLDEGQTFQLDYLLFRAESLVGSSFEGADRKLALRISAGIARRVPTAPVDEVIEAFEKYIGRIDADTSFLDVVLSYRGDMDIIAARLEERARSRDHAEIQIREFDMAQRKQRAIMLQEQRIQAGVK